MAKILSVSLLSVPQVITVNDNKNDFSVETVIEFHELDILLKMEYCMHLFVYDVHGEIDAPLVLPNWDESKVLSIALDKKDDYLGFASRKVMAIKKNETITIDMSLSLGKLTNLSSYYSKKLEVFATLAPAIGRASKWSEPFEALIEF